MGQPASRGTERHKSLAKYMERKDRVGFTHAGKVVTNPWTDEQGAPVDPTSHYGFMEAQHGTWWTLTDELGARVYLIARDNKSFPTTPEAGWIMGAEEGVGPERRDLWSVLVDANNGSCKVWKRPVPPVFVPNK